MGNPDESVSTCCKVLASLVKEFGVQCGLWVWVVSWDTFMRELWMLRDIRSAQIESILVIGGSHIYECTHSPTFILTPRSTLTVFRSQPRTREEW